MTHSIVDKPMVSVVMITYNHRPYIEKAVESILGQRVDFGVELVIGEDHSKDGTREYLVELARREPNRVRLIISDENVGMMQNLARTEEACRGRYIAYCEGDDYWNDSAKLAKQVAFLESRPRYSMVHSHCNRYYVETKRLLRDSLTVPRGLDDERAFEDMLLGRRVPLTVTVLARRERLNEIVRTCPECSDPKWPMADTQRWLELSRVGCVGCIHEPLATTNVLLESAGQSRDPRKRLNFYMAARAIQLHYIHKYPISPDVGRLVRSNLDIALLQQAYDCGNPDVADELYQDYVAAGGSARLRAGWLKWGSVSPSRRRLLFPVVRIEAFWRRVVRRLKAASA